MSLQFQRLRSMIQSPKATIPKIGAEGIKPTAPMAPSGGSIENSLKKIGPKGEDDEEKHEDKILRRAASGAVKSPY